MNLTRLSLCLVLVLSTPCAKSAEIQAIHNIKARGSAYQVTEVLKIASPTKLGIPVGKKQYTYQTLNGLPVTISSKEMKENKEELKGILDRRPFEVSHPYIDKGSRILNIAFSILGGLRR